MTIRDSNTAFITILDPLPLENIGWWLEVYDFATSNLLARVYSYLDFSFSVPLSDIGAFEWNMSDYDALWTSTLPTGQVGTYILDGGPHYVDFIDEGVRRQRCIIDKHILGKVRANGERPRQITGKGLGVVLDWAIVLPVSIGASTSGNRAFHSVSWASVFMTLYAEAIARGDLPSWVLPSFTATVDSLGVAWGDVGDYSIDMGQSLLDLLQQCAEQQGFEWRMYPNGYLAAAPVLGDDRSGTVRFFEHESIVTADDTTDRTDLRTHVYVLGGDNLVTLASDTAAATTWGRRSKWVNQASATNASSRGAVANTLLGLAKNPLKSRSFKVPFHPKSPDGVDTQRRAFRDYETGMIVGYGPQTDSSTNYRVVEMAVSVSPDKTELEITVMSRIQREIDRLTRLLTRILAGQTGISGAGGASGSISSTVIASAIRLGDLLNVQVGSAVAKDGIYFDGTNWVAGRSALDDLSDADVSTAVDGQVLTRTGGIWTGGSATALPWNQDVSDPLSALTNLTTFAAGTWAVGTGCIQQTNAAATPGGIRTTAKVSRPSVIAEVEIRHDSGSSLNRVGIDLFSGAVNDGGALAYITGNGASTWTVSMERAGQTALTSGDSVTYTSGNWAKIRIMVSGTTMTVWFNGVYVATASTSSWSTRIDYVGFYTYQAAASFRNLKVWTLAMPA